MESEMSSPSIEHCNIYFCGLLRFIPILDTLHNTVCKSIKPSIFQEKCLAPEDMTTLSWRRAVVGRFGGGRRWGWFTRRGGKWRTSRSQDERGWRDIFEEGEENDEGLEEEESEGQKKIAHSKRVKKFTKNINENY